jgi:hypothetical protein
VQVCSFRLVPVAPREQRLTTAHEAIGRLGTILSDETAFPATVARLGDHSHVMVISGHGFGLRNIRKSGWSNEAANRPDGAPTTGTTEPARRSPERQRY